MNWLYSHLGFCFGRIISPTSTSLLSFVFFKHIRIETSRDNLLYFFFDRGLNDITTLAILKLSWRINFILLHQILSFLSYLRIRFAKQFGRYIGEILGILGILNHWGLAWVICNDRLKLSIHGTTIKSGISINKNVRVISCWLNMPLIIVLFLNNLWLFQRMLFNNSMSDLSLLGRHLIPATSPTFES